MSLATFSPSCPAILKRKDSRQRAMIEQKARARHCMSLYGSKAKQTKPKLSSQHVLYVSKTRLSLSGLDPAERVVKASWYKGTVVTHRPKPVSPIVNQGKNKNKQPKKPKPAPKKPG
uniref:Uncharacterized protein n=1 Tax=Oryza brachyantha TaxID=4533 RepID=J3KZ40_ORYBR